VESLPISRGCFMEALGVEEVGSRSAKTLPH
jgi:hypothetical protein